MRIGLFTPFSPEIGGGSVQFRSLLPELRELDIEWFYLANSAVGGANRTWLGTPFTTGQFLRELCGRSAFLPGSTGVIRQLVDRIPADLYWVVAHSEGILVADELCARGKRVHLSVHDDPECMFKKSRKYRLFAPLISREFAKLLKSVESVDVISPFMQKEYERRYKIDSFPIYRYVPELAQFTFRPTQGTLRVGHIGSVYHAEPFRKFVEACLEYTGERNLTLKIARVGNSPEMDAIAAENSGVFENHGELEEREALPILASCDFLYSMYPTGNRFKEFRRMSIPMKLSTYVQAQRPIFAHTPEDSSLARVVSQYRVGCVCPPNDRGVLKEKIGEVLNSEVKREQFEILRIELMGESQIHRLRKALAQAK